MTKKFPVIPVEDYYAVVEKLLRTGATFSITDGFVYDGFEKHSPIIATIGKRVENIPLIELPDDEVLSIKEYEKFLNEHDMSADDKIGQLVGFGYGYRKAASKGKYTEEDMKKAYYRMETRFKGEPFEVFLQSLQKKPVEVELEMETYRHVSGGLRPIGEIGGKKPEAHEGQFVKITNPETNTITPINVKYDN